MIRFIECWVSLLIWFFAVMTAFVLFLNFTCRDDIRDKWYSTPLWIVGSLGVIFPVGAMGVLEILHWFKVL